MGAAKRRYTFQSTAQRRASSVVRTAIFRAFAENFLLLQQCLCRGNGGSWMVMGRTGVSAMVVP